MRPRCISKRSSQCVRHYSKAFSVHLIRDFGGTILKTCFTLPFDLRRVSSAGRLPFGDSAFIERSAAHSLGACSIQAKSALLLLVTRILADDHNATLALNDLALLAHRFN